MPRRYTSLVEVSGTTVEELKDKISNEEATIDGLKKQVAAGEKVVNSLKKRSRHCNNLGPTRRANWRQLPKMLKSIVPNW